MAKYSEDRIKQNQNSYIAVASRPRLTCLFISNQFEEAEILTSCVRSFQNVNFDLLSCFVFTLF